MITTKRVAHRNKNTEQVKKLFQEAFPIEERIPFGILMFRTGFKWVDFFAYYEDGEFIGAAYTVSHKDVVFLFYLAVNSRLRSKGYGSTILKDIRRRYPDRTIILDIETLDETAENSIQRKKRRDFYLRNGYTSSGLGFDFGGVKYELLQNGPAFEAIRCRELFFRFSFGAVRIAPHKI